MAMNAALDLLGGAERVRTRVRGFVAWEPRAETRALLDLVDAVLDEYRVHLPLTCRQIFYRLVGAHGYAKTECAYDRLCEHINRARRAGLISMEDIRDAWSDSAVPTTWASAEEWLRAIRAEAAEVRMDRQAGQETRLVVLCEAAGMVPQIAAATEQWTIPVYSSGGFDSTTTRHDFACTIAEGDRPTEVLHLGDHDPSGAHMFLALAEDVEAFAEHYGARIEFTRLAESQCAGMSAAGESGLSGRERNQPQPANFLGVHFAGWLMIQTLAKDRD
jgi:hypothetical protein